MQACRGAAGGNILLSLMLQQALSKKRYVHAMAAQRLGFNCTETSMSQGRQRLLVVQTKGIS
jgi:hypothetical protein